MTQRMVIPFVVAQHADELAILWNTRRQLSTAGHVALNRLGRFDARIAAHMDGCVIAGSSGLRFLQERLVDVGAAQVFAVASVALESEARPQFEHVVSAAEALPPARPGLIAAIGWVSRKRLAGVALELLTSPLPFRRYVGLAACRLHNADPGRSLPAGLRDPDMRVRSEALRTAGALGNQEFVSICRDAEANDDPDARFWALCSAVLLGDRGAVDALARIGWDDGAHRARAFRLSLQARPMRAGQEELMQLAGDPNQLRWLIQGSGIVGDLSYVPWLITHMGKPETSRAAGEAFTLLTGADLALLDLERKPPADFESGPNDNPNDENVEMDPDDGLPWPDQEKVAKWWATNGSRFQSGQRYFVGKPVTREHCIDVLKNGYQRQRILAAHYLCLLEPGTPLFNTSAPAWRQERLLATMT